MPSTHLDGLDKCDLHRRTPYGMMGVSQTQFSIARYSGAIQFKDDYYIYFPDTDELIRDDVLRWKQANNQKSISECPSPIDHDKENHEPKQTKP